MVLIQVQPLGGLFWISGLCLLEPPCEKGMDWGLEGGGGGRGGSSKNRSQHNTDSGSYRPEFPSLLSTWVTRRRYHTAPGLSLSIGHVGMTGLVGVINKFSK